MVCWCQACLRLARIIGVRDRYCRVSNVPSQEGGTFEPFLPPTYIFLLFEEPCPKWGSEIGPLQSDPCLFRRRDMKGAWSLAVYSGGGDANPSLVHKSPKGGPDQGAGGNEGGKEGAKGGRQAHRMAKGIGCVPACPLAHLPLHVASTKIRGSEGFVFALACPYVSIFAKAEGDLGLECHKRTRTCSFVSTKHVI